MLFRSHEKHFNRVCIMPGTNARNSQPEGFFILWHLYPFIVGSRAQPYPLHWSTASEMAAVFLDAPRVRQADLTLYEGICDFKNKRFYEVELIFKEQIFPRY
jgi:hypothetical protein